MCLRGTVEIKPPSSGRKRRNTQEIGKSRRQGRQLTVTGQSVEMCAPVLPVVMGNNKKLNNYNFVWLQEKILKGLIFIYSNISCLIFPCTYPYSGVCYFWPSACSAGTGADTISDTEDGNTEDYEYDYDYDSQKIWGQYVITVVTVL